MVTLAGSAALPAVADRTEAPTDLTDDYRSGDFLLASPHRTLLTTGVRAVVPGGSGDLADRVRVLLRDLDAPLVAGALPFDRTADAHLVVPRRVRLAGPLSPGAARRHRPLRLAEPDVTPIPDRAAYRAAVAAAVTDLAAGELRKVVLARALRLGFAAGIDVAELRQLLLNLAGPSPDGYTFATPLPGGRALLGASPELLLSRTGRTVATCPLAGSAPRRADPVADRESARALAGSAKNLAEHRVVVADVLDTLRPFCRTLSVPDGPSVIATPSVWHLATRITGELADPDVCALRLATQLYPTPALCGAPRDAAYRTITELEPFDRGFYGGSVGWVDATGDGQFAVAIRCAELAERSMVLYAGCGIMPDSSPADELDESTAKFRTLLGAMGLDLDS